MAENYKLLKAFFEQVFGDPLPGWLVLVLAIAIIGWATLKFLPQLARAYEEAHKAILERIVPLFYNQARRTAAAERRQFAEVLVQRLATLNAQEDFSDDEFTELEAEVEVKGIGDRRRWRWLWGYGRQPRRVSSLSSALRGCGARLVLLEGEPGSGKSTAVRHLALILAQRAARARGLNSVLPVYVNLREFHASGIGVTAEDLKRYIISNLLGGGEAADVNPLTKAYVEREFDNNLKSGGWLFLFDSFDETPTVLRSANFGPVVQKYGAAIERFLELSHCLGIVASRPYRAPNQFGWTHFQILPLSAARRSELIARSGLDRRRQQTLLGWLRSEASSALVEMTDNPMFLRLLCRYWQEKDGPPSSAFQVYDAYFASRFAREVGKLSARGVSESNAREIAVLVAYCLSANRTLGLSCTLSQIKAAVREFVTRLPSHFDNKIAALLDARILRTVKEAGPETFRFEHRRFQEYFATGYLLEHPDAVEPVALLTDPSWREATVVLLQRQVTSAVPRLLEAAQQILAAEQKMQFQVSPGKVPEAWPGASFHVLKLLADGHGLRSTETPGTLRTLVGEMIKMAWRNGRHDEKQSAIELMSLVAPSDIGNLLSEVFAPDGSRWFQETAVRQFPKLDVEVALKQRCLYRVIGQSALDSRLGELRYLIDRLTITIPNHTLLNRLAVVLSHMRIYYFAIAFLTWFSLTLATLASPFSFVSMVTEPSVGTAAVVVGLSIAAVSLFMFADRLTLVYRTINLENKKEVEEEQEEEVEGEQEEEEGGISLSNFARLGRFFAFSVIWSVVFLLPAAPLNAFASLFISTGEITDVAIALIYVAFFFVTLFMVGVAIANPICNLMFLPTDVIEELLDSGDGIREMSQATPSQQLFFIVTRFNPWRSTRFRLLRRFNLSCSGAIVLMICYVLCCCSVTGLLMPAMMENFEPALANRVGMYLGLPFIASIILYYVGLPLIQLALAFWFRLVWTWTVPGIANSLKASRFLALLKSCRSRIAARTLLDRVVFTRCLEANSHAAELLGIVLNACNPDKRISGDPEVSNSDFAVQVWTFASERRDWLVSLGSDFRDQLAKLLTQVKAFSAPESPPEPPPPTSVP